MNDRELLEMAAKAAGLEVYEHPAGGMAIVLQVDGDIAQGCMWNPLEDDGDALRLAVRLGVRIYGPGHTVTPDGRPCIEGVDDDEFANTRRAIVRAAAEIGKAKEDT